MYKIKKNREYKALYNCKNSVADYNLVLFFNKTGNDYTRFGFTCAKKIKLAVNRNRIRRSLKEIVRLNDKKVKIGYDIIIMARNNSVNADYRALEKSFFKVLQRSNLLTK